MAEAFLNTLGGEYFSAESAGLEPGKLNPLVVKSLREIGIDISNNKTKDVFEFLKNGKEFDFVITVCDETSGERCPFFPGGSKRLHWTFEDPSSFGGTEDEKLFKIAEVRDAIKVKTEKFIKSNK
jgi:arsenate reductase (thioredoxin)